MQKNLYGMSYAILTLKADLEVFVNLPLNDKIINVFILNVFHSGTYYTS